MTAEWLVWEASRICHRCFVTAAQYSESTATATTNEPISSAKVRLAAAPRYGCWQQQLSTRQGKPTDGRLHLVSQTFLAHGNRPIEVSRPWHRPIEVSRPWDRPIEESRPWDRSRRPLGFDASSSRALPFAARGAGCLLPTPEARGAGVSLESANASTQQPAVSGRRTLGRAGHRGG